MNLKIIRDSCFFITCFTGGCKKDTAPNMCVNQATFWSCVDISIAANEEDAL